MKLRIRAIGGASSATFKIEVPPLCSLQGLEDAVVEALESRGIAISRPLKISLNKKDAIHGHASSLLSEFGICNGDLLFYFERSDSPSEPSIVLSTGEVPASNSKSLHASGINLDSRKKPTADIFSLVNKSGSGITGKDQVSVRRELCAAAATRRASTAMSISLERKQGDTDMHESAAEIPSCSTVSNEIAASAQVGEQDLFEEEDTGPSDFGKGMLSNSIPSILQRILRVEHESVKKPTDLLFLAIHAVMQETGFVVTNAVEEGHTLPRGWSNSGFANVSYTLKNMPDAEKGVHSVELKYLTLGSNLVVYGSISDSGCSSRKLSLLSSKHIIDNVISRDDTISSFCDVFELWKCAKDELSLPLLTNLCEMAGLPVPSSLLVIPTDLKMKILECLPALDLVKVGCTCSELRHLCANDELWKRLFHYDFGNPSGAQQLASFRGWKSAYAVRFLDKKRSLERRSRVMRPFYGIASRSRFPRIIGGDYDVYPLIGNEPFGAGGSFGGFEGGLGGFRGGLGGFRGAQGSLGNLHGRLRDEEPWNYW